MFDEVLSKNGRVMEAYDWLAKLYEAQNDMSAAQETLENAVQLSPLAIRRQKSWQKSPCKITTTTPPSAH